MLAPWKNSYDQPRQQLKSRDITLPTKVCLVKAMVFPVVMYECESWTIKKAEHQTIDAFKPWCWRRLKSPLGCKEIKPVNPNGDQSWIFTGRTDVEAEAPIFWPPDAENQLTGKDPEPGKDWRQEEKGTTEDEMVGWHHQLDVHQFEQAPGVGDGQGSLACCSPWGRKELDTTEQLNWRVLSSLRFTPTQPLFHGEILNSYLAFLSFSFLTCKLGIIIPISLDCCQVKLNSTHGTWLIVNAQ